MWQIFTAPKKGDCWTHTDAIYKCPWRACQVAMNLKAEIRPLGELRTVALTTNNGHLSIICPEFEKQVRAVLFKGLVLPGQKQT